MSERAAPFYCPYCGEEELRPSEAQAPSGTPWECSGCQRAFTLTFLGLLADGPTPGTRTERDTTP
ncbi:hypothetical protein [Streptomyces oceani]|uniref:Insertion element protein n=1 Tax=Streptomyces oceani TaxID=1075402 RepID=A0A1E7KKB3_9ACTN|nr:hypothetical protein [Streptomyces oceani]OEV04324.1 hypothetical protein AN216_09125 [Streptomyces oceani]